MGLCPSRNRSGAHSAVPQDDVTARLALDTDSGFVWCGSANGLENALKDGKQFLELGDLDEENLSNCLKIIDAELSTTTPVRLKGLSLTNCGLNSSQLKDLASSLQTPGGKKLSAVGVSNNRGCEDSESWKDLWKALPSKVTKLDFGCNDLGDNSIAGLGKALHGQELLEQLFLDSNGIGSIADICKALPETGLSRLDLGDNSVDEEGACHLAKVLPETIIRELVLGSNPIGQEGAEALFETLPRAQSLEALFLDNVGANDDCLESLAKALVDQKTNLNELVLAANQITDKGVKTLIPVLGSCTIAMLDVAENAVGEETLKVLNLMLENKEA